MNDEQIERYSRHIILKTIGGKGQEKLLKSRVLIIGIGGLGSPAALYLASAGVGTLGIIDGDSVDLSNLQRQIIHFTPDIGRRKVDSAKEKINQINPDVNVIAYYTNVYADNIKSIISDYDFIIDGTDNFSAKFLINDASVLSKKPYSHAGIAGFYGQTLTYVPGNACFRCIFESPPPPGSVPSCSEAGVLGAVAGILGTIQAAEAIRYILGIGELLTNVLLHINIENMQFGRIMIKKNPQCVLCGDNPLITELMDYQLPVCKK